MIKMGPQKIEVCRFKMQIHVGIRYFTFFTHNPRSVGRLFISILTGIQYVIDDTRPARRVAYAMLHRHICETDAENEEKRVFYFKIHTSFSPIIYTYNL